MFSCTVKQIPLEFPPKNRITFKTTHIESGCYKALKSYVIPIKGLLLILKVIPKFLLVLLVLSLIPKTKN